MKDKLTPKQKLFCQEYLVDLCATKAAVRAGFSAKRASEIGYQLLQKTTVSKEIQRLKNERSERLQVDAEWVLRKLIAISDRCMQEVPVMKWDAEKKAMVHTGEYTFDSTSAIRATELVGKHIGFFEKDNEQQKQQPVYQMEVRILPSDIKIARSEQEVTL